MTVLVILAAAAASAFLLWFFFGPRRAQEAAVEASVQRATIVVAGGYSPNLIQARQGMPLQLTFDRQESGDCTSQVVFPELKVTAALPAYARTTVEVRPDRPGRYGFACGMNMVHGTLVFEPGDGPEAAGYSRPRPRRAPARRSASSSACSHGPPRSSATVRSSRSAWTRWCRATS
jgi:Cu+-exporting ATPase